MFDDGRKGALPEGVAEMAPGVELAATLAHVDRETLSGFDRVVVLAAYQRLVSHFQAEMCATIVSVHEAIEEEGSLEAEHVWEAAASEVRAALRLTRRTAETHLGTAWDLMRLPAVWLSLQAGDIDLPRARVILDGVGHLEEDAGRQIADVVLESAAMLTTGQLRSRVSRLCMEVDPSSAQERYELRLEDRRLVLEATEAGTANLLGLDLPAAVTNQVMRRIDRIAKHLNDESRSLDQIRADVYLDLLAGRGHHVSSNGDRGRVDVRVDLETLCGLADRAGEIPGFGPVVADVARQVAVSQPDAEWRVTVTGDRGEVLHVGTTRRRPTADQRRQVEARNPTCVFPGCRMPAAASDLDHNHPWAETHRTVTDDLAPLCRHNHTNRHRRGWRIECVRPGVYQWTSPLGHGYTVGPEPP